MNDAWLAGLLEGEGCFRVYHRKDSVGSIAVKIQVGMTDKDVLDTVANVAECGNVSGPYFPKAENTKPIWQWNLQHREDVKALLLRILPYMHTRRTAKIYELLEVIEQEESKRGLPYGVSRTGNKFRAYYKRKYLGVFETSELAKDAYELQRSV